MLARVIDNGRASETFSANIGVKQGCVPASTLFDLTFSVMLMKVYRDRHPGINIIYRTGDQFPNTRRIRASGRPSIIIVYDLLFADDCAPITAAEADMQRSMSLFAPGRTNVGLAADAE
ncbi:hypothetical protein SprV_0301330000 [Sparganum proliferum]